MERSQERKQPTVKAMNAHLFAGTGYCMIYAEGWQARISWARTRKGVKQGRVINWSISDSMPAPETTVDQMGLSWVTIPADARVELS